MSSFFRSSHCVITRCCCCVSDMVTCNFCPLEPIYSHVCTSFAAGCTWMVYDCFIHYISHINDIIQSWIYFLRNCKYILLLYSLLSMIYVIECATVIHGTWNDDYLPSGTAHGGWFVTDHAVPPNIVDIVTEGALSLYHGPFTGDSHSGTIDEYSLTQYFECAVRSAVHISYIYSHCGSSNRDYLKLFMNDIEQTSTEKTKSDICLDDDLLEAASTFCGRSKCSKTVGPWSKTDIGPIALPVVEWSQQFKIELIIGTNNDDDGTAISDVSITCIPNTTTAIPTTMAPTTTTLTLTTSAPITSNPTTSAPTAPVPSTINPTTLAPTALPTTSAPTTNNPTTAMPTTYRPTTTNPTTVAPNTAMPTTAAPNTAMPTTAAPNTAMPTTVAPTTANPTTVAPTTIEPTTARPTTSTPTTMKPVTANPTTAAPTTRNPTTFIPTTTIPTTSAPNTGNPTTSRTNTLNPTTTTISTANPTSGSTWNPITTIEPTTMEPITPIPSTANPTTTTSATALSTAHHTTMHPVTLNPTEPIQTSAIPITSTTEPTVINSITSNTVTANPITTEMTAIKTTISTETSSTTTSVSNTLNSTTTEATRINPATSISSTTNPTASNLTTVAPTTTSPLSTTNTITNIQTATDSKTETPIFLTVAPVTEAPDDGDSTTDSNENDDERAQLKMHPDDEEEQCTFICWECLQQIDVIDNDISWNLTFIAPNETNCTCPNAQASAQNNRTISIGADDTEYQLTMEKYTLSEGDDAYGLRLSVLYWMNRPEHCSVSYFVNENEFFGVEAQNVLSITFTICGLSEDRLTDEALEKSRNGYIESVALLFNVSENDVNAVIDIGSFCANPPDGRRLLSTDRDQEVTIAVIFADAGDVQAAQQGACDAVRLDHPEINGECHVKIQSENEILYGINEEDSAENIERTSNKLAAVHIALIVMGVVVLCLLTIFILYCYASQQKKKAKDKLEVKYGTVSAVSPDCARNVVTGHERITSHAMNANPLHKANMSIKALPSAFVHEMQMTPEKNTKVKHDVVPSSTYTFSSSTSPRNNIEINMQEDIEIHVRTSTTITHIAMDNGAFYSAIPVVEVNNAALSVINDDGDEYFTTLPADDKNDKRNSTNDALYATPMDMIKEVIEKKKANEISIDDITMGDIIGKGRFGTVFKAKWEGNTVVVKQLNSELNVTAAADKSDAKLKEMRAEIILASSLPTHNNLVEIFGFIRSPFGVVMHYMEGGSVQQYVYRAYRKETNQSVPTIIELLYILEKAAAGLKFLHSYELVHRDIACRNILLGKIHKNRIESCTEVRISDFGLTRQMDSDHEEQQTQSKFGPLKWMAPESIKQKIYSKQSDVYMFGITMWEIFYGMEPYPNVNAANVAINVVTKHQRPQIADCLLINQNVVVPSAQMPDGYKKLMEQCWTQQAKQRPHFTQITQRLSNMLEQHPTQYWE